LNFVFSITQALPKIEKKTKLVLVNTARSIRT